MILPPVEGVLVFSDAPDDPPPSRYIVAHVSVPRPHVEFLGGPLTGSRSTVVFRVIAEGDTERVAVDRCRWAASRLATAVETWRPYGWRPVVMSASAPQMDRDVPDRLVAVAGLIVEVKTK